MQAFSVEQHLQEIWLTITFIYLFLLQQPSGSCGSLLGGGGDTGTATLVTPSKSPIRVSSKKLFSTLSLLTISIQTYIKCVYNCTYLLIQQKANQPERVVFIVLCRKENIIIMKCIQISFHSPKKLMFPFLYLAIILQFLGKIYCLLKNKWRDKKVKKNITHLGKQFFCTAGQPIFMTSASY